MQRVYIDTSVIGGMFDLEFSIDTLQFFDKAKNGELKIVYSQITIDELYAAPERVKNYLNQLPDWQKEFVEIKKNQSLLPTDTLVRKLLVKRVGQIAFTLRWLPFTMSMR